MARKRECLKRIMEFFGVDFLPEKVGEEYIGTCFSCSKEKHLYLNEKKNVFQCKKCGITGPTYVFLDYIWEELRSNIDASALKDLADYRKLPIEAFLAVEIGYLGNIYYFPVRSPKNKLVDLRWYKIGQSVQSLDGVVTGLYGIERLAKKQNAYDKIYVCEGEFDCIALNYLLHKTSNNKNQIAVSLPGVNTQKRDWVPYFLEHNITLAFDFDGGGKQGREKAYTLLHPPLTQSLKFVNWPDTFPSGYDINDFISAYAVKDDTYAECYTALKDICVDVPDPKAEISTEEILPEPEYVFEHDLTLDDIINKYSEYLKLNNNYIDAIKLCLATIFSIQVGGQNPVWLFLVGPPGYGKTAILTSFKACAKCLFLSSVSKHNLVSGFKTNNGIDPSVFPKLKNRCLILKDYTEILAKTETDRKEIFSILRGAFDGQVDRMFGNGVKRVYNDLNFPILAGVTDAIKEHSTASIGERFLQFDIFSADIDRIAQQSMAVRGALFGRDKFDELGAYISHFILQEWDFSQSNLETILNNSAEYEDKIYALGAITTWIRTEVKRHEYGLRSSQIMYEPRKESPNRVTVQLFKLALSLAILEGKNKIDEDIYNLLKKVSVDTISGYNLKLIRALAASPMPVTKKQIKQCVKMSDKQLATILADLEVIGIVKRMALQTNCAPGELHYFLSDEMRKIWQTI